MQVTSVKKNQCLLIAESKRLNKKLQLNKRTADKHEYWLWSGNNANGAPAPLWKLFTESETCQQRPQIPHSRHIDVRLAGNTPQRKQVIWNRASQWDDAVEHNCSSCCHDRAKVCLKAAAYTTPWLSSNTRTSSLKAGGLWVNYAL